MSRRLLGVAVAMVAALALAACGDSGSSSASTAAPSTSAAASSTTAAGGAATSAASGGAATTAAGAAAAANATVGEADNAKIGQKILVDSAGMTIYLFEPDGTSQTSTVPAAIKANWPAVVATGSAVAGSGLDASKLTVVPQPDGTKQVAYNGHLLYTFVSDTAPGQANGQDLGGAWYVVTPAGDKYEAS